MKPKNPRWLPSEEKRKKKLSSAEFAVKESKRREKEGAELANRRRALINPTTSKRLTQEELGQLLEAKRNTVTRWECGRLEIPPYVWRLLSYIEKDPALGLTTDKAS